MFFGSGFFFIKLFKRNKIFCFCLNKESPCRVFHYSELTLRIHPEVYEPAEDTFLLIDALDIKKGKSVLEIGTGCGIIALECARVGANVICTDINPYAVELTKKNYLENKSLLIGNFEVRKGDIFEPIKENEVFDIIVFNPPYLPTKKDELIGGSGWFDIATNGGIDGIKITSKFIAGLPKYLRKNGKVYFVHSSLSDRDKIEAIIKKYKFQFKIIKSCSFNDETISVFCLK
jgi:release factor glutamine methyltransferase